MEAGRVDERKKITREQTNEKKGGKKGRKARKKVDDLKWTKGTQQA